MTVVRVELGERTFVSEEYGVAGSYCFVPASLGFLEDRAWVHAARLSGASRALALLADRGVPLSYDFTDHWDQAAAIELCPRLQAAFFSGSALGEDGARRLAEQAVARGARVGVVTRGAHGVVACVGDRLVMRPAEAVTVVDTLGAGDAFIAGYVAPRSRERTSMRLSTAERGRRPRAVLTWAPGGCPRRSRIHERDGEGRPNRGGPASGCKRLADAGADAWAGALR